MSEGTYFETNPHSVVFKASTLAEMQKALNVQERHSGKGDISV